MPTLTTIEQPVTEDNDDQQEGQVVDAPAVVPKHQQSASSSSSKKENPVAMSKPTPPKAARAAAGGAKRKASAKITPTSEPASKRKKQQQVSSNQLSIASFFQQKNPPPASPLANPPPASTAKTSAPAAAVKPAAKSSSKSSLAQRRLAHQNTSNAVRPMDSLALCVPSNAATTTTTSTGIATTNVTSKMTPKTTHRVTTTKESLRDIVLGCVSSTPPSPASPLATSALTGGSNNHDLLPRILAPSLLKKKRDKKKSAKSPDDVATPTTTTSDKPTMSNMASTSNPTTPLKGTTTTTTTPSTTLVPSASDYLANDTKSPKETSAAAQVIPEESREVNAMEVDVDEDTGRQDVGSESSACKADDDDNMEAMVEHDNDGDDESVVCLDHNVNQKDATPVVLDSPQNMDVQSTVEVLDSMIDHKPEVATKKSTSDEGNNVVQSGVGEPSDGSPMSAERQTRLGQVKAMKMQYCNKITEMITRGRDGLEEEIFEMSMPNELPALVNNTPDFPDVAAPCLAALVEGSRLSLSALTSVVVMKLNETFRSEVFTCAMVTAKVKVMAKRESFLDNPSIAKTLSSSETKTTIAKTNVFEDENPDRMWRWEVISLDLFSDQAILANVKKARAARRKLRGYFKALSKLLLALHDTEKLLSDTTTSQEKLEAAEAKVSQDENQVLKFEREQEKSRLAAEARKRKQEEQVKKAEEQKRAASGSRAEQKKQKAAEREELKRKKAEEKERQKAERDALKRKADEQKELEKQEREAKSKRQQAQLRSFFGPKPASSPPKTSAVTIKEPIKVREPTLSESAVPVDFRSQIGTLAALEDKFLFRELSLKAIKSRKRKTQLVSVPVYVTTTSDETFDAQPYLEQKLLSFPNKYKFLSFHEDCRPAYHGTWSKRSEVVTGRNPFGKDTTTLDYENDSEGEWEEGDDDLGEDIESNCLNDENEDVLDDEEGDLTAYNYEDGWMQRDDDFGTDVDEETKLLLQKKLQGSEQQNRSHNDTVVVLPVCAFAPMSGGVPLTKDTSVFWDDFVEGFEQAEALRVLACHEGEWLGAYEFCLDAFPPLVDELSDEPNTDEAANPTQTRKKGFSDLSPDDLRLFARFVHHNTLPSKDKVLDELRSLHKSVVSSRAQGARTLDAIAAKKRHLDGIVRWEVKTEVLLELGLEDLMAKESEVTGGEGDKVVPCHPVVAPKVSISEAKAEIKDAGANLLKTFLNKKSDQ